MSEAKNYVWNGKPINYKEYLPLEEKRNLASLMVTAVLGMDESTLVIYKRPDFKFVWDMMLLEAYTDMPIPSAEKDREAMYDIIMSQDIDYLRPVIYDTIQVTDMAEICEANVRATHRMQTGLEGKFLSSFGSILDGKDITETLGHSEEWMDIVRQGIKVNESEVKPQEGKIVKFPNSIGKKQIDE